MADNERRPRQQRRPREDSATGSGTGRLQRIAGRLAWGVGLAALAGLVFFLLQGDEQLGDELVLDGDEVAEARTAAGCVLRATGPAGPATHLEEGVTVDQVDLGEVLPPTGTPHRVTPNLPILNGADRQLDVLAVGHNMEHGAIVAWYDPAQVDAETAGQMGDWSERLNNSGFSVPASRAGIFVSPFETPGISSGKAIALRAWNVGVDCDTWDETVANSFVVEMYGAPGGAPEAGPFPDGTLRYADPAPAPFTHLPEG